MLDFESSSYRRSPDPDLVPIIDALTAVVFFLLISASFTSFSQHNVPDVIEVDAFADIAPNASPRVYVIASGDNSLTVAMKWKSGKDNLIFQKVPRKPSGSNAELIGAVKDLLKEYKASVSEKQSLILACSAMISSQELINVLDVTAQEGFEVELGASGLTQEVSGKI